MCKSAKFELKLAMAEKSGNEAHEQENDYSSDDSDVIDAVDLYEEIDGEAELIFVSRQVRVSWLITCFL